MTDLQINSIILEELRELRSSFNVHANDTVQRLSTLETQIDTVLGDAQPGRLSLAEKSIKELQQWKWRMAGIASCAAAVISVVVTLLTHLIH